MSQGDQVPPNDDVFQLRQLLWIVYEALEDIVCANLCIDLFHLKYHIPPEICMKIFCEVGEEFESLPIIHNIQFYWEILGSLLSRAEACKEFDEEKHKNHYKHKALRLSGKSGVQYLYLSYYPLVEVLSILLTNDAVLHMASFTPTMGEFSSGLVHGMDYEGCELAMEASAIVTAHNQRTSGVRKGWIEQLVSMGKGVWLIADDTTILLQTENLSYLSEEEDLKHKVDHFLQRFTVTPSNRKSMAILALTNTQTSEEMTLGECLKNEFTFSVNDNGACMIFPSLSCA
jgi:hypothetical protein